MKRSQMTTIKKEAWFTKAIREKDEEIAALKSATQAPVVGEDLNTPVEINSYARGFYECMCHYGLMTKVNRRQIRKTILARYKGEGTDYVRKIR
jgi:hypothetical protein